MAEQTIDLHTHSVKSDGSMTPSELVRHAKEAGLATISLTDHDGVSGVAEAAAEGQKIGLEVVPGIELSVQSKAETHILGYYIDIAHPALTKKLEEIRQVRVQRNYQTLENLNKLGFDITMEEARALAPNGLVARAHFARLMAQKGYTKSVKEAFDLYLSNGKPGYSSIQLLTPEEGIGLIKEAGGLAFAAHLHHNKMEDDELVPFLKRLKEVGLDGVEGYYTEYTPEMQEKYQRMARELSLAVSGGTDFHGAMKPHIQIGTGMGNLRIPYSVLEQIKNK